MQAKKRYLLVSVISALLALCYYGALVLLRPSPTSSKIALSDELDLGLFMTADDFEGDISYKFNVSEVRSRYLDAGYQRHVTNTRSCTMETCFDLSRCRSYPLKVYVYPYNESDKMSQTYRNILSAVKNSVYYTRNPHEACLFILPIDTTDRDHLSEHYVKSLHGKLKVMAQSVLWNSGRNHIIFNFFSGTWPDYVEKLDFNTGQAIIAKASISSVNFRPNFDISLPLVPKNHPEKGGKRGSLTSIMFPPTKKYLLVFKGKRYLHGIGSETRNSLYHLHNGKDIILLTTCKHGKRWKVMKDARCEKDNRAYDKHDFQVLMANSTFCLVPRGRRLGSFRFLEALQAGCIPVLASNGWQLPFDEVINWNEAVIWVDERLLQLVPDILRSIPASKIMMMQQHTQRLWEAYFSSIQQITTTTLQIVWRRIKELSSGSGQVWNSFPGALQTDTLFSQNIRDFPFHSLQRHQPSSDVTSDKFTAVIYCTGSHSPTVPASPLYKIVRLVSKSAFIKLIIVIWSSDKSIPRKDKWPSSSVPLHIIQPVNKTVSSRFYPLSFITTDAVLSLDEDSLLIPEEMDYGFKVWKAFPNRIVGYIARSHYWDENQGCWGYTSKPLNQYSMVRTGSAFYHRYYNHLYTYQLNAVLHKTVDQSHNCEDILMNFLVSDVTKLPPIKLTQRRAFRTTTTSSLDPDHFLQRQACINTFTTVFGYMPLVRTSVRFDPALYKDPVSAFRKRYRKLELAGG